MIIAVSVRVERGTTATEDRTDHESWPDAIAHAGREIRKARGDSVDAVIIDVREVTT